MCNNPMPPFMLREAGTEFHERPNIQVKNTTVDDQSIYFPDTGFWTPIKLWGMFQYFVTSRLTSKFMMEAEEV